MAYDILMPQLSDSMDEGKLISWKIKEGQSVKKGDVIAEVESDKAIMEVQSFKDGVVKNLTAKEGENIAVGRVMATIEMGVQSKNSVPIPQVETQKVPKSKVENSSILDDILGSDVYHDMPAPKHVQGDASPKAKAIAARYDIDIKALQQSEKLPIPTHEEDIETYRLRHYFTPKAKKLLELYNLDNSLFTHEKKYDSDAILGYIQAHDIPLPQAIDSFQKALIIAVEESAKKPIYHIYDRIDATLVKSHKEHTMTVWIIKLFSKALMQHEQFRSALKNDTIMITPNASISVAVSDDNRLYMPVFKDVNLLTADEINTKLTSYEEKANNKAMSTDDMQDGTFGISNLGMLGIERFDAMINKQESGCAAIGAIVDGKISVTLTLDHRLINGFAGALFMQTLKTLALDVQFFKDV